MLILKIEEAGYSLILILDSKIVFNKFYPLQVSFDDEGLRELEARVLEGVNHLKKAGKRRISKLYLLCQDKTFYLKEVKTVKNSRQRDVLKILGMEMKREKGVDISKFSFRLNKINSSDDSFDLIQVRLYPDFYDKLLKRMGKKLRIKPISIISDYEILEFYDWKEASLNLVELRDSDVVLSNVVDSRVRNSTIIKSIDSSIISYLNGNGRTIFYGNLDSELFKLFKKVEEFQIIDIKKILLSAFLSKKISKLKKQEHDYRNIFRLCLVILLIVFAEYFFAFRENISLQNSQVRMMQEANKERDKLRLEELEKSVNLKEVAVYLSSLGEGIESILLKNGDGEIVFYANSEAEIGKVLKRKEFEKFKLISMDKKKISNFDKEVVVFEKGNKKVCEEDISRREFFFIVKVGF